MATKNKPLLVTIQREALLIKKLYNYGIKDL